MSSISLRAPRRERLLRRLSGGDVRSAVWRSAEGKWVAEIVRELGVTEQTYYR